MRYRALVSVFFIIGIVLVYIGGVIRGTPQYIGNGVDSILFEFFKEYVMLKPETGTELKLPKDWGIPVDQDKLNNVSDKGDDRLYALFETYRDRLQQYDESELSKYDLVTRAILIWYFNDQLEGRRFRYHTYIMNPMFSFHNQLTTLLTEHHDIHRKKDAMDYLERLEGYTQRVEQLIEQLEIRKKKRMLAPRFIAEKFSAELDSFIAVPIRENVLYTAFVRKINNITDLDDTKRQDLTQQVERAIHEYVYPSYEKMIEYIEDVIFFTDEKAGVWRLPDGNNYYAYCLRHHTTTDLTPADIHELGLSEVARIQSEIKSIYEEVGITGDRPYAELTADYGQRYYKEPYRYTADEQGTLQTLEDYQAIIDKMYDLLPSMFASVPAKKVRVERVPEYKQRTAGTYYQPITFDPESEGIFYANLSYQHFKPGMKTLTYHEAIPGHHLQFVIETESPGYHPVKSLFFFTGYAEGWALYAEKLAREYNMYTDTHERLGNLRSELFRAVRLVVDTGIHWKKWTRKQAYEYMQENTGWAGYGEIDRYITWPGQACAYKVGELSILALRDIFREHMGDAFDVKEFHTTVLEHGSMPLDILEELVEEYIDTRN
jgi:uncharacterized protein (DUF885 family)